MTWERIIYDKIDNIARITLNRPEHRNALDPLALEEMLEGFRMGEADDDIRVIILRGTGPDFSSGHDISKSRRPSKRYPNTGIASTVETRYQQEKYNYFDQGIALRDITKPTIAQVHGHCLYGASKIPWMCDIVICSEDAVFANGAARMAVSGVEIFWEPWVLGVRKAKELLFTGDPIDAKELYRLGAINKIVPREKLDEEVMHMARRIALAPPFALTITKRSLNRTLDIMGQMHSWDYNMMAHWVTHASEEFAEVFKKAMTSKGFKEFYTDRDAPWVAQEKEEYLAP